MSPISDASLFWFFKSNYHIHSQMSQMDHAHLVPGNISVYHDASISFFSLEAATWVYDNRDAAYSITLYDDGCGTNRNCAEACQHPATVFSNLSTLHNCIVYPAISGLVAAGSVTQHGMRVASDFGISGHENISLAIERILNNCMDDICNLLNATDSSRSSGDSICKSNLRIDITPKDVQNSTFWELGNICDGLPADANPDLGGK